MTGLLVLNVVIVIVVSGAMAAIPFISRKTILFAVTVEPEFRNTAASRQIIRRYETIIIGVGLAAAALEAIGLIVFPRSWADGGSALLVVVIVMMGMIAYVAARRRVRKTSVSWSAGRREVALTAPQPLRTFLPRPLVLLVLPYVLLLAFALWLGTHLAALPALIPVHFAASGQANRFVSSSGWHPFVPLVIALALLVILNAFMFLAPQLRQLSNTPARIRVVNLTLLEAMTLVATIFGVIAILPTVTTLSRESSLIPGLLVGLIASGFIAIGLTIVIGLHRHQKSDRESREIGDRTPDECWKLGLIYVNRKDPALWVEKRSGLGYTLNFGHPVSVVILLAIVGIIVAVSLIH